MLQAIASSPPPTSSFSPVTCRPQALPEVFARMHFDLGSAYLELGLPQEAQREWAIAADHPSFRVASLRLIDQWRRRPSVPRATATVPTDADVERALDDLFDLS